MHQALASYLSRSNSTKTHANTTHQRLCNLAYRCEDVQELDEHVVGIRNTNNHPALHFHQDLKCQHELRRDGRVDHFDIRRVEYGISNLFDAGNEEGL